MQLAYTICLALSLGIIIDTSIIMVDHYSYYRDRRGFVSILGALLTTIGALGIVWLLPEKQQANLTDFSLVIVINLPCSWRCSSSPHCSTNSRWGAA